MGVRSVLRPPYSGLSQKAVDPSAVCAVAGVPGFSGIGIATGKYQTFPQSDTFWWSTSAQQLSSGTDYHSRCTVRIDGEVSYPVACQLTAKHSNIEITANAMPITRRRRGKIGGWRASFLILILYGNNCEQKNTPQSLVAHGIEGCLTSLVKMPLFMLFCECQTNKQT